MSRSLNDIKKSLDKLGQEYENSEGGKKQAVINRIYEEIACLGEPPLSESNYPFTVKNKDGKDLTVKVKMKDLYDSIIKVLFFKNSTDGFTEKFRNRENKDVSFSGYLLKSAKRFLTKSYNKDNPIIKGQRTNITAIEQKNNEGEEFSLLDTEENAVSSEEVNYEAREQAVICLTDFLALMNHEGVFSGRKDNESNRDFVKLLYTEKFSELCKTQASKDIGIHNVFKSNEAVALRSIDNDFADHFEQIHCDSIEDFELVPYKQRKYFNISQSPEKELETPFDAKVYITFYEKFRSKSVSNALVHRKREQFRELVDMVCGKEKYFG